MQNSEPVAFPLDKAVSSESAIERASGFSVMMALMSGSKRSMRAMKLLTMSRHVVTPENKEACRDEMVASRTSNARDCDEVKGIVHARMPSSRKVLRGRILCSFPVHSRLVAKVF